MEYNKVIKSSNFFILNLKFRTIYKIHSSTTLKLIQYATPFIKTIDLDIKFTYINLKFLGPNKL